MGFTTDIYDDVDQQNLRLAAADRANAARTEAANLRQAVPPNTGERSFGFRSGANRPGGVAERHYNLAAAAGSELGAPTSFVGGEGAPTPIGVIRGMTQTFATDAGGPQLSEYATPLRAKQAFNRNEGEGEYEPSEGPKLRLAASLETKNIDKLAASQGIEEGRAQKAFRNRLLSEFGVNDPEKGLVLPGYLEKLALRHTPTTMAQVDTSFQRFAPEAATEKQLDLFNNPATREQARVQALTNYRRKAGPNADPAEEGRIKTAPITRENLKGFMDIYNWAPKITKPNPSLKAAAPPPWTPETPSPWPGILKKLAQEDFETAPAY